MAAGSVRQICDYCKELVKNEDNALQCEGICQKWFHIKCLDVSVAKYKKIVELGTLVKWECKRCMADEVNSTRKTNDEDSKLCCQCFNYIKILTDQISDLTSNHLQISENMAMLQKDNKVVKEAISSQANLLGELLAQVEPRPTMSNGGNLGSYANSVKGKENIKPKPQQMNEDESVSFIRNPMTKSGNKPNQKYNSEQQDVDEDSSGTESVDGFKTITYRRPWKKQRSNSRTNINPQKPSGMSLQSVEENSAKHGDVVRPKHNQRAQLKKQRKSFTGSALKTDICNLNIVEKAKYLFVSRLAANATCEELKQFMDSQQKGEYEVTKLNSKYPGYSSFKVRVPVSIWDKVFSADFWPSGIFVNIFKFKKGRSTQAFLGEGGDVKTRS